MVERGKVKNGWRRGGSVGLSMKPIFREERHDGVVPRLVQAKRIRVIMADPKRRGKEVDKLVAITDRMGKSRVRARRNEQAYLEGERRAAGDWKIWFEPLI